MATVKELLRTEADGTISFGNYELSRKSKLSDYEHQGDLYKVKTFVEITKLEKNGIFVYESVPGTTVLHLKQDAETMEFEVEGPEDAQITVEMAESTEYEILLNGESAGVVKTNMGGKLSFNVELGAAPAAVKIIQK